MLFAARPGPLKLLVVAPLCLSVSANLAQSTVTLKTFGEVEPEAGTSLDSETFFKGNITSWAGTPITYLPAPHLGNRRSLP